MDAETFYNHFRESLNFLGLRFHNMYLAQMSIKDGDVVISYQGLSVSIKLPKEGEQPKP